METTNYHSIEDANNLVANGSTPESVLTKKPNSSSPEKIRGSEGADGRKNSTMQCGAKKVIIIAVVLFVVLVITLGVVLALTLGKSTSEAIGVSFEDAVSGDLYPKTASLRWISSNTFILQDHTQLKEVNIADKKEKVLVKNLTRLHADPDSKYVVSNDRKYLLYSTNIKPIYRHSTKAKYFVYDVATEKIHSLKPKSSALDMLQYATWSPTGNQIAFVYDNNVYVSKTPTADPVPLTTDGKISEVFNGVPDWVYEEEVLSSNNALYWSPKAQKIAFIQFNDTEVPRFDFPVYRDYHEAYTTADTFRYPKAGFTNPTVKLFVRDIVDPTNSSNVELFPPTDHHLGEDYLVSSVAFRDDVSLLVIWTNRIQNQSVISLCDATKGVCHINLKEDSSSGWVWVIPTQNIFLAEDGSAYFLILPQKNGGDSYPHVAMVSTKKDIKILGLKEFLTSGKKEIDDLLGIRRMSETGKPAYYIIFYSGSREGDEGARERHLYVVNTKDKREKCLSCDEEVGKGCTYFSASFYQNSQETYAFSYFVLTCTDDSILYSSGPTPFTATFQYSHKTGETKLLDTLERNKKLEDSLAKISLPRKKFFETIAEDGMPIRGQIFLPSAMKYDGKHPVLFSVYSGPSTSKVNNRYVLDWHSYMCTEKGYVIVNIDGRGCSMRGDKLRFAIYRRLGGPEIDDIIIAATYLLTESEWHNAFDRDRVGVWGWSYGGYATSHVLGRGSGAFTCGAAVAPVSSWTYYDSIYTERYMSTPTDNPDGYANTQVMAPERVEHFRNAHFLLIHGTADDNVHFQNSMQLTTALIRKQIPFETQVYPDKNHAIGGSAYRIHLYSKLTSFFDSCSRKEIASPEKSRHKRSIEEFPVDDRLGEFSEKQFPDCLG